MRCLALISMSVLLACPAFIGGQIGAHAAAAGDVERIVAKELVPFLLGEDRIGGAAIAVRIGGRTLFYNYGFADMATRRPVTTDALFNLGSVRKVFEATVLAQAVQRGELGFDDRVSQYVTELKQGKAIRDVTLGELASHTSGLLLPADHPPWPERGYTLNEFIDTLNAWAPEAGHGPGEAHTYTHAGYILLQLALERRFGRPIGAMIGQRVRKPLGLNETLLPEHVLDTEHAALPGAVQGYGEDGKPIGIPGDQQSYYKFPGTGQMFSSARDLATLLAANLGEIAVDPELNAALRLTQRGVFHIDAQFTQALAWEICNFGGPTIVDKPGGINNASAYIGMVPDKRLGIVVLVNRGDRSPHDVARKAVLPALAGL